MNALLLVSHIGLLSLSIALTAISAGMALYHKRVHFFMTVTNVTVTTIGLLLGTVLLLSDPINAKCVVLLSYLAAFIAVELYVKRRNHALASSLEL